MTQRILLVGALIIAIVITMLLKGSSFGSDQPAQELASSTLTDDVRQELLKARDEAWRSFFTGENRAAFVEKILGSELIAIQQSGEKWENRDNLIKMAMAMEKQDVKITHIEFPRTEIQLFDNTAILYYTYILTSGTDKWSATDAGRGTEVFVYRNGRWIDVGWHLDNGAFVKQNDKWIRVGEPSDK